MTIEAAYNYEPFIRDVRTQKDRMFYVSIGARPGFRALMALVEYTWYPPRSPDNAAFELYFLKWQDVDWLVFSCPASRHEEIKVLAERIGMVVADGAPLVLLGGGKSEFFPGGEEGNIGGTNLWTIENAIGSPIYTNRANEDRETRRREIELVECFEAGDRPSVEAVRDFIWGTGSAEAMSIRMDVAFALIIVLLQVIAMWRDREIDPARVGAMVIWGAVAVVASE